MCLCSFKCIEMSVSLFLMKMQHNHILISYLWLKQDVGTKCREAFKVSTQCQSQREAVWFDRSVRGAGPLQTNQIHFSKLPGSGGYAGVFISHHHTSQGSSAVWYTACTGMHGRRELPGRWETMQTNTTFIIPWCVKCVRICVVCMKWAERSHQFWSFIWFHSFPQKQSLLEGETGCGAASRDLCL